MSDVEGKIDELRRFVDRRFAELSMEIHATAQLMDFSETSLTDKLDSMKEQLAAVLSVPTASTRNSGVELEAVVQTTEAAANRIMEAAEAIGDWLLEIQTDPVLRERINDKVNAIFEACSFQDLTSQRIRRAIDHLHQVETMLGNIARPDQAVPIPTGPENMPVFGGSDLAQMDIDKLLADF